MPRIIYSNPLSTVGEGIKSGMDVVQEQERHESLLKSNEKRMQAFDAELQESLAGLEDRRAQRANQQGDFEAMQQEVQNTPGFTQDQRDIASGFKTTQGLGQFHQLALANNEIARRKELMDLADGREKDLLEDGESGVDPNELASRLAAVPRDDPEARLAAMDEIVASTNHRVTQVNQRMFAREQMRTMMVDPATSESFRPPMPGMPANPLHEQIQSLIEEISEPPRQLGKGSADYIGALSELRLLTDPTLQGGVRRQKARYEADFAAAMAGVQGMYGAAMGPNQYQEGAMPAQQQDPDVMGGGGAAPPVAPAADGAQPPLDPDVVPKNVSRTLIEGGSSDEEKARAKAEEDAMTSAGYNPDTDISTLSPEDQENIKDILIGVGTQETLRVDAAGKTKAAKEKTDVAVRVRGNKEVSDYFASDANLKKSDMAIVNDLMKLRGKTSSGRADSVAKEYKVFDTREQALAYVKEMREKAKADGEKPTPEDEVAARAARKRARNKPQEE